MASIEVDEFLPQPPGRVWQALTDPALRMVMGILGGGWRGHLIRQLGTLLGVDQT